MTLRQAAEMALDVLRQTAGHSNESQTRIDDAKHALVQALAQPEQERMKIDASAPLVVHPHPAFAAPLKREWVGLTVEEVLELLPSSEWKADVTLIFAKAIETKVKQKNT